MQKPTGPMELLNILEKSNCGECGEPSCLAFASAVYQGKKQLSACPRLSKKVLTQYEGNLAQRKTVEESMEESLAGLKRAVAAKDLDAAARRLGERCMHGRLTLSVCGKNLHVDAQGYLSSEIHIHPWIAIPVLTYILEGEGLPVSGTWVPFRELKGGAVRSGLFEQRCEKPLKAVADTYTDLFEDMLHVFNGKQVDAPFDADILLVLRPLPGVPILFCYWNPEDALESSLHIFFDATADRNLPIDGIYALIGGLVRMFEKVAQRHGLTVPSDYAD
jgi:hypothetical protein